MLHKGLHFFESRIIKRSKVHVQYKMALKGLIATIIHF